MRQMARRWRNRIAWLTLAALAVVQSGCLAVAAGCAAGGAAGYAYYKGRLERDYVANRDDVWAALHTSLHLHTSAPQDPDYVDAAQAEALLCSPMGGMDAAELRRLARVLHRRERHHRGDHAGTVPAGYDIQPEPSRPFGSSTYLRAAPWSNSW